MKQDRYTFNSIEKALTVLQSFHADQPFWGVRGLSAHLGFSPATVQRILQTLKAHAFVDQDSQTRQYRLGNIYFKFLHTLQSTFPFTHTAVTFMQRLLSQTQETVHLNVIDGLERICIDNLESSQNLKATMPIGSKSPLYAGASSKCLLAFSSPDFIEDYLKKINPAPVTKNTITDIRKLRAELTAITQKGYASSLGERNPGLGSLSAPVLNHKGIVLASLSLAIPEIRFKDDKIRKFYIKELLRTTADFSKTIGYHKPG